MFLLHARPRTAQLLKKPVEQEGRGKFADSFHVMLAKIPVVSTLLQSFAQWLWIADW
jgi:hypothetical protein